MEEAARARRQFDEKFAAEKKREGDMEAEVCNYSVQQIIQAALT